MRAEYSSISKAVRTLQQLRPTEAEFNRFKERLVHYIAEVERVRKTNAGAMEEVEKGLLQDFLKDSFYTKHPVQPKTYKGNTGADLTIRSHGYDNTLVLIECKSGTNTSEMVTQENLLAKAVLECVVYYGFEKEQEKNDHIKHVVVTNSRDWFVFDAAEFRAATWDKAAVRDAFKQWQKGNLDSSSTAHLHARLKEVLTHTEATLHGTLFDLWSYRKFLKRDDEEATRELLKLWRFFHPAHLLKEGAGNDSNALNKNFYHELLYILGLREVKDKGRKLITRLPENERHPGALIEHTMQRLDRDGALGNVADLETYGATKEDQLFNVGMELCITWLNRVLFLKLLEAQLLRFHNSDRRYAFLSPDKLKEFDQFHALFFDVMAVERDERAPDVREAYAHIPYLNSSLFEPTTLERQALQINQLKNSLTLPLYGRTVLVEERLGGLEPTAQEYLLRFLQAYDFGSEQGEGPKADNRPLITASVLGLIFEKINGYRDGSFYTPGYITMYMCRETIRRTVLDRFNEGREQPFSSWAALVNHCENQVEPAAIAAGEAVVDALRICDPAVGSGHFLVSALNELIAIKSELRVLTDTQGKRLSGWHVEVVNDELVVTDRDTSDAFQYTVPPEGRPLAPEKQRVQSALFEQKRKLIENGLFGVDINANSVKICRLRLWIELLKNAYYTEAGGTRELRTLPNIDINIKQGNSVLQRYKLTDNIDTVLGRTRYTVEQYQGFVADYQEATDRDQRRAFQQLIEQIEQGFTKNVLDKDPRKLELGRLATRYQELTGGLFGGGYSTDKAKAKAEAERQKLEQRMGKLQEALEAEKAGLNHKLAFDWRYRFPQVLDAKTGAYRGFDVILGNPPYIRQEEITAYKHHLRDFRTFTSTADLFVYFMELGHELLAPGGYFCYIVANKWMRAGYGEKLRNYLGEHTLVQLVDFGDLPVFEEATTYPCILLSRRGPAPAGHAVQAIAMPELRTDDLAPYVQANALNIAQRTLVRNEYRIANESSSAVLAKIREAGVPLGQYLDGKIYRGVLTGYNKAFVIDAATKDRLIAEDARSAEVIKPFLTGKEVKRYGSLKIKNYILFIPWHFPLHKDPGIQGASAEAEEAFKEQYPAVYAHLLAHKEGLSARNKAETGKRYEWYALQRCAATYYEEFDKPRIITPSFSEHPAMTFDPGVTYSNNKTTIVVTSDKWLLAVLNSKVSDYVIRNVSSIKRGGWFDFEPRYLTQIPIVEPPAELKERLDALVTRRMAGDASVEAEIDAVVYGLYGLGEDEVRVVEGR